MEPALTPSFSTPWLSRFVERVSVVEAAPGAPHRVARLPDGRTTLAFRELDDRRTDLWVAGPRTRAHFKHAIGVTRALVVQFKPGWSSALLGVPAHALTDRMVPLQELWGASGSELCLELTAARNVAEQLAAVSNAVTLRTARTPDAASSVLARRAVRLLESGEARVDRVAERLGVSARHLRRAFTSSIGIGPKDFARTVRLQRALRLADSSSDWGRIASAAGYYDQAHLIADFRELIGLTPSAFLKRAAELQSPK